MKLAVLLLGLQMLSLVRPSVVAQSSAMHRDTATWALHYDPKTLDPAKVDDEASEAVRYLTAGVLIRFNRHSMALEPDLAESWSASQDGRIITLHLRRNLKFSDGSPLTSNDVVATLKRTLQPATGAPVAEEFLEPGKVVVQSLDPFTIQLRLPMRVVQIFSILDEIAIEPANRLTNSTVTAGPFSVVEYHAGQYLRLRRNEHYWKKDATGTRLPYLSEIRLDIVATPEAEELRFLKGQYALLDKVGSDAYDPLSKRLPGAFHDLGPSLNTEQMWFNQSSSAPLPDYKKRWFASRAFRSAVSMAINRADLARIAFNGHATPANSFISPANTQWHNHALAPAREDRSGAIALLHQEGFHIQGTQLLDAGNHPVNFSLLINAGNTSRQRMAALLQQDLAALGMQVNVVTLDFPALIERLMHSQSYEAVLLGLDNVQPDPSSMMNVWMSHSPNHQWNPAEKTPATTWEAEIDREMTRQAESSDLRVRKQAVDNVQRIVSEELPFIYLVYPNVLCASSPRLGGVQLSILQPDVTSSVELLQWRAGIQ